MAFLMACAGESSKSNKETSSEASMPEVEMQTYGEKVTNENAMPAAEFINNFKEDSTFVKLAGTVDAVCQAKGCWMNIDLENGKTMKVTFKDYGFFVPKDLAGKQVVIEGKALKQTTSVEEQRHYAQDAGKSEEEIATINEPKEEVVFEAVGVLVSK